MKLTFDGRESGLEGRESIFEGRDPNLLALWLFIFSLDSLALITCDIYDPPEPEFGFQLSLLIEKFND
jgi:hypothetical protein